MLRSTFPLIIGMILAIDGTIPSASAAGPKSLLDDVIKLRDRIRASLDPSQCQAQLESLNLMLSGVHYPDYDQNAMVARTSEIISALWDTQVALRKPLAQYPAECIPSLRVSFYSIRSMIDYVGTFGYITAVGGHHLRGEDVDWGGQPVPILDPKAYHGFLAAPGVATDSPFKFQAGDILMTRGYTSAPSALITETPVYPTHFSHIVFVHVTPEGETLSLEAFAGEDLNKYAIDYALKNENTRMMVLRPRDSQLGERAGDFMYHVVEESIRTGKRIPFNYFPSTTETHDRLWCGEVARWAYDEASNHQVMLPLYKNAISRTNLGFLKRFKIQNSEIYEANDLEVDPRFDALLEFRDWGLIRDSRYKSAVLREILRWQDDYGYRFTNGLRSIVIASMYYLRKTPLWPLARAAGAPDFPEDATKGVLVTFDEIQRLAAILYNHLEKVDEAYLSATGWPMTNDELVQELSSYRERDRAKFLAQGPAASEFHRLYRPARGCEARGC